MKKKELEKLEEINNKRKLDKEAKNTIAKKMLNNLLATLNIILLFVIFIMVSDMLVKDTALLVYKISCFVLLAFAIILFEIAYKKDSDKLAINGIEILVVAIITLLMPYTFVKSKAGTSIIVGCYLIALYYIIKDIVVYNKQKNKYILEHSDIPQIIKKESQDEMAKEEKEKIKEEVKKAQAEPKRSKPQEIKVKEEIKEEPKRKRGRPKIIKEQIVQEEPKRKRGRPKKIVDEVVKEVPKRKRGRPKKIVN